MKVSRTQTLTLLSIALFSPCQRATDREETRSRTHTVTLTTVQSRSVTFTRRYVCQIHSRHRIDVRSPVEGYLAVVPIREDQTVKQDDLLFEVQPLIGNEKPDETHHKIVSIKAPFDGVVGRLPRQQGSFVQKTETLTTLSDNSLMRADFNVPEAQYLEYRAANLDQHKDDLKIELILANGNKFDQPGKLGAIGAEFHGGNVAFNADFPNPDHVLHHGQSGNLLISQVQNDAILVPQRATLELLTTWYVYVVDKDNVAHRREIVVQNESEDNFVITKGVRSAIRSFSMGFDCFATVTRWNTRWLNRNKNRPGTTS